uniref:arylesterase n=2 Tax=Cyprinus carpio TaxID=7962 RepID=A0A9R1SSS9_CYPCA
MGKLAVFSLAVALAAFIGERLVALRHVLLYSRELTQNYPPNCHLIEGIEYGAEDITILDGFAFLSTGLKYPGLPSYSDDPGNTLNLMYTDDKDGDIYLFVENHPQGKIKVESFRFVENENALQYIKTIKHELLHKYVLISVYFKYFFAVGTKSFYATNDHYFTNGILKFVEPFLSLSWCDVVYYSPQTVQVVAGGFPSTNSINISPDKRQVLKKYQEFSLIKAHLKNHSIWYKFGLTQADCVELGRIKYLTWIGHIISDISFSTKKLKSGQANNIWLVDP